jgi:hypothetical protein
VLSVMELVAMMVFVIVDIAKKSQCSCATLRNDSSGIAPQIRGSEQSYTRELWSLMKCRRIPNALDSLDCGR